MTINSTILQHIKLGHHLIAENNTFRCATWGERVIRALTFGKFANSDVKIAEMLIAELGSHKTRNDYKDLVEAATRFSKVCCRSGEVFKRVENTLFAHKCHQILSLPIENLIESNGSLKNGLLPILKNNFLHYVIAKANGADKETAIVFHQSEIYIRAKEGESFLNTPEQVEAILNSTPPVHADRESLQQLQIELQTLPRNEETISTLQTKLSSSHYRYTSIKNLPLDKKGILISQAYLTKGLENHQVTKWKSVQPTFIEESQEPVYKLRVITRLPEYAFTKTKLEFFIKVMRNIFNFRAHGHSWVELVKPEYDNSGKFTQKQEVIDIGYYFHPLDSRKRFQNADPMAYMPIPKDQLVVEEIPITQEQFEKGKLYLNQVQALMLKKHHKLHESIEDSRLSADEKNKVQFIWKMIMKSTCLGFASAFKKAVTGLESDNRAGLRQWLFPKESYKKWDRLDKFLDKTILMKWFVRPITFFSRMELPLWVKSKKFSWKSKTCNSTGCSS